MLNVADPPQASLGQREMGLGDDMQPLLLNLKHCLKFGCESAFALIPCYVE